MDSNRVATKSGGRSREPRQAEVEGVRFYEQSERKSIKVTEST